jgi:hypothetical protein
MAPKHHPAPLSGGDRKTLKKELSKSRAMTNIFAERAEEKRRVEHCPPRATSITDRAVENIMLLREVRQSEASAGAGASLVPFLDRASL